MIEGAVKAFFLVGLLLLGAMLVRRDLFLNPSVGSNKQDIQSRRPQKEPSAPICAFSKPEYLDLRGTTNVWNPLLLSFLVNDRPVNIALGSDEHLYVQLKAYEFCTENSILLDLRTLHDLEKNCVGPVFSVLIEKIEKGDFVRPISREDLSDSSEKLEVQMEDVHGESNHVDEEGDHESISDRAQTDSEGESFPSSELSSVGDDALEPALDVAEVNNS